MWAQLGVYRRPSEQKTKKTKNKKDSLKLAIRGVQKVIKIEVQSVKKGGAKRN